MVKVSIKSDKVTPFGEIFPIMDALSPILGSATDDSLAIQRHKRMTTQCDLWEGGYTCRRILTNDYESALEDAAAFYNQSGETEGILDDMSNGFGWSRLPKSFMNENAVFLIMTAIIRNFYRKPMSGWDVEIFSLKPSSRIMAFVFRYVSVATKWIKIARQHIDQQNLQTHVRIYLTHLIQPSVP